MQDIELDESRYTRNWDLLEQRDALIAHQINITSFNQIQFCRTEKGELNLSITRYGLTDYYHNQKGALEEAQQMASKEFLEKAQIIYMFGLGLGYIYEAVREWLHEKPNRYLVLLEDDLEVIHNFLYGDQAEEILNDSQVVIFYFQNLSEDFPRFSQLHTNFLNLKPQLLALPYYLYRRQQETMHVCYRILYDHSLISSMHQEYLSGQSGFLNNFYHNLLSLPQHGLGEDLFGKFKNQPAIICGAGPSLEKNIDLLKTLSDRALIFAGGSSLNVLNTHGLIPHFGVGIDPNPEQYHRLLTNHTFHIPFFYRSRMAFRALGLIQGPKLYVAGSYSQLTTWFEKELKIDVSKIDEGHNVVNFCTEIARLLGCNPIIYVGLDLAYTEVKTYASGIKTHPLWLGISNPYQYQKDQQLVLMQGIDGQPIRTKWDWMAESDWVSHYARKYPELQIINATEGGLGFNGVPNETLADVTQKYLQMPINWEDAIHAEIQMGRRPISLFNIIKLINQFKESLENCRNYCITILNEIIRKSGYSAQAILEENLLTNELAYQNFLEMFDKSIQYVNLSQEILKKEIKSNGDIILRFKFLEVVITQHLNLLNKAMQQFIFSPPPLASGQVPINPEIEFSSCRIDNDVLIIDDLEIGLSIKETFKPDDQEILHYSDGAIKKEAFYQDGKLHGPVRYYSPTGVVLAETWFIRGQRQGKSLQRYASGKLYSARHFKDNLSSGTQLFFYENGEVHLSLPYEKGVLNGTVSIYNVEGKLQRELQYKNGKRHGTEKLWNTNGQLFMEAEYQDGQPIGKARQWHSNGQLEREITIYSTSHEDFDLSVWNEQGALMQSYRRGIEDFSQYYDQKQQQVDFIEGSLTLIMNHVQGILKKHSEEDEEITEALKELRQETDRIKNLKSDLDNLKRQSLSEAKKAREEKENQTHDESS